MAARFRDLSVSRGETHGPDEDSAILRRKDYADDPEDETFLFISYNMSAFKEYVKKEEEKGDS
jgi:hypothetical protein